MAGWAIALMIFGILIVVFALYNFLPELILHIWHVGTLYRGAPGPRRIALTFDDGPDKRYTPQVLDILSDADVKATFFLVGQNAKRNSELVKRMVAEGHDIGSHSQKHRHHWLLDPLTTWRDVSRGKRTLESISGLTIRYFRPPWGAFNWFTRLACTSLGLTPTLWSARAIDWLPGEYEDEVEDRIVRGAHPGAIVLCHDAGGAEGSTENTIAALPSAIARLRELGYEFATVSEMAHSHEEYQKRAGSLYDGYPFGRRMLIAVWSVVEAVFTRWFHVVGVNEIFRIGRTVWHHGPRYAEEASADGADADGKGGDGAGAAGSAGGDARAGSAGSTGGEELAPSHDHSDAGTHPQTPVPPQLRVSEGAPALDLHFRNETLITISSAADHRSLVRGLRQAKNGMKDIARIIYYHPDFQDIEVIAAPTLMNRGIEMLGFHVEDLPKTRENLRLQRYMRFLMGMYHPEGFRRLREGTRELELKLVWMTREELYERTGLAKEIGIE